MSCASSQAIFVLAALQHDHAFDRRAGIVSQRRVHVGLQGNHASASPAAVGGDDHAGAGVVDPVANCVRAEPAKHDAVNDAQARAGQHGHGKFRNHGHVEHDPVAGFQALSFQTVGKALHVRQQVGIRDDARVARLAFPVVGHLVSAPGFHVPVQAVGGDVGLAVHEPLDERRLPLLQLCPRLEPGEAVGDFAPEAFGILEAAPVKLLVVLERRDVRGRGEVRRRGE